MRMVHQRRRGTVKIPKITRRKFVQLAGASAAAVAASSLLATSVRAADSLTGSPKRMGVLTDITRCVGCRSCEVACNKANELPPPQTPFSDTGVFDEERRTTVGAHTVVNRYQSSNGAGPVYRKAQCMHCNEPACVSACPVAAMVKTPEGPTIWDERLCMGCRYCMIACPFSIPTYEYDNAFSPRVLKCTMCYERVFKKGGSPACVEACPQRALLFGEREDLLWEGQSRIINNPETYVRHIYGEHEAGGTSWLYLSSEPFEDVGLPSLEETGYGQLTWDFLTAGTVATVLVPLALMGVYRFGMRRQRIAEEEALEAFEALKEKALRTENEGGDGH